MKKRSVATVENKQQPDDQQDEKNERERAKKAKPTEDNQFAPTRAWLERRDYRLDFEKRVGKTTVVSSLRDKNSGFYCEICKVLQKDSNAYLNHLNSRIHQKNLGMSLRVQRVDKESVKNRIEKLSQNTTGEKQEMEPIPRKSTRSEKDVGKQVDIQTKDDTDSEMERMAKEMGLPLSFASKHE